METHIHVVVAGAGAEAARALRATLVTYTRAFNRRRGGEGSLVEDAVEAFCRPAPDALAKTIRYVHHNPLKTTPPLVRQAYEYPWSSARAFAGLSLAGVANVALAREMLGQSARAVGGVAPPLVGAEPLPAPGAAPGTLLGAVAETYGLPIEELWGAGRGANVCEARAAFLQLGRLESYSLQMLAYPGSRRCLWTCARSGSRARSLVSRGYGRGSRDRRRGWRECPTRSR